MRLPALLLCIGVSPALLAQPANPCPYSAEYLTAQFGQPFKAGVPENGLIGKGCRYDGREVKLWLDSGPMPAPTAAQWRKMSSPPGVVWQPVPGDPDGAVFEVAKSPAEAYPTISYERKTWLVQIRVTGDIEKGYASRQAAIGAWQTRLARLQRIP